MGRRRAARHLGSAARATGVAMSLIMTLVVRNEADILEVDLDYHLAQGVDFVIVTDHGSVDDTAELLRRYERDGAAHVIRDDAEGHQQSARVTRMAQLAATRYPGAWVIHNDADGFWWPLVGSLRDVFDSDPDQFGQVEVPRNNFLPVADGARTFHSRLVYREASSLNPRGLPLEAKVAHRAGEDIVVAPGNHAVFVDGLRPVPGPKLLEIFHFPMRNFRSSNARWSRPGTGYEKLPPDSPEVGRDQMILLELQRKGGAARLLRAAAAGRVAPGRGPCRRKHPCRSATRCLHGRARVGRAAGSSSRQRAGARAGRRRRSPCRSSSSAAGGI